jgi:hypothetical protein
MRRRLERALSWSVTEYLIGPALLFAGGIVEGWGLRVAIGVPGLLIVAGSQLVGNRARERSDARFTIFRLLTVMVSTLEAARPTPVDRSLRANLMLVDPGENVLRIAYYTTGYDPAELRLLWASGQGCAGEAWQRLETVFAPEEGELPVTVADADRSDRPWNMTPEQVRLTAITISSVLSVPVFLPDGSFAGVLNLDDRKSLDVSQLGNPDIRAAAEALEDQLGELLKKAGTELPETRE